MALDLTFLTNLGFPQILLWLLSFALIFGVLDQVKIPKDKPSRGIISIVVAFLVLFSVPTSLITTISSLSTNLILVILAVLTFIVFLEAAGVKAGSGEYYHTGREVKSSKEPVTIFERYSKYFAIVFVIIAVLLFVGAGGLGLLGINLALPQTSTTTLLFFAVIVLAVGWLIANPEEK